MKDISDMYRQVVYDLDNYFRTGEETDFIKWTKQPYQKGELVLPISIFGLRWQVDDRKFKSFVDMFCSWESKYINRLLKHFTYGYLTHLRLQEKELTKAQRARD